MILVTGGTGLVGAHLLLQLVMEDTPVRAIYRDRHSLDKAAKIFSYYPDSLPFLFNKIEWVEADINDLMALEAAFEEVRLVYHCAALISFNPSDFKRLQKVNAEGTANIVNLCLSSQVEKLCYVSTIGTIGRPERGKKATEEDYGLGRYPNVYAISKHGAEMEIWRGAQEGLRTVIVNPGIILGPGNWDSGSGEIFRIGARGSRFSPPGGSGFVAVKDVVQIMIRLMGSMIDNHRFILVAENCTYREILGRVAVELSLKGPTRNIPIWMLQIFRWVDWLWSFLSGSRRRLTRSSLESLKHPVVYDNAKVREELEYTFEALSETIRFCCSKFKDDHPELFR